MTKFEQAEAICTQKTLALYGHKYQLDHSADPYASWDFSGATHSTKQTVNYFIEVKNRDVTSTCYPTVVMELTKFENLKAVAKANGDATMFYLNFYTDGKAYVFNLNKLSLVDIKISVKSSPKTTMGDREATNKIMIEIPFKCGKSIKAK